MANFYWRKINKDLKKDGEVKFLPFVTERREVRKVQVRLSKKKKGPGHQQGRIEERHVSNKSRYLFLTSWLVLQANGMDHQEELPYQEGLRTFQTLTSYIYLSLSPLSRTIILVTEFVCFFFALSLLLFLCVFYL